MEKTVKYMVHVRPSLTVFLIHHLNEQGLTSCIGLLVHTWNIGVMSARTSAAAGPGHGELQPLPGHHGNEENWRASEICLEIFYRTQHDNCACQSYYSIQVQGFIQRDLPSLRSTFLKCTCKLYRENYWNMSDFSLLYYQSL